MKLAIRILFAIVAVLWLRSAFYAVDFAEYAYVTRFGNPVATLDGSRAAGLHVKMPWPIDSVQRIDRRLQSFDLAAVETLTRDAATKSVDKTLAVDASIAWRIPDAAAADRFVKAVGSPEQARRLLTPRVNGRLAAVIGGLPLDDLIAVADDAALDARTAKVREAILADGLKEKVLADYGIEIVDLRVRRFGYPEAVRASIAERIRSERSVRVASYESEGRRRAAEIASEAEKDARTLEAEARAKKTRLEGAADVEADRLRNDAQSADPAFYAFLQKLRTYQSLLSETRDVLLLSSRHPLFDLLLSPPKP